MNDKYRVPTENVDLFGYRSGTVATRFGMDRLKNTGHLVKVVNANNQTQFLYLPNTQKK